MEYVTCYYDREDRSGNAWDIAIEKALEGYPERHKIQVLCLPIRQKKRTLPKKRAGMGVSGVGIGPNGRGRALKQASFQHMENE